MYTRYYVYVIFILHAKNDALLELPAMAAALRSSKHELILYS